MPTTPSKSAFNIGLALICAVLFFWTVQSYGPPANLHLPHTTESPTEEIPNIVHYTQLKKDANSSLEFTFESFLSLYSAVLHFDPKVVYIHTDHNASTIASAKISGSKWTQKVLNTFPHIVTVNEVVPPAVVNGKQVHIEAKSDFVRWEVLYEYGGFKSVVGRQSGGKINSGTILTRPASALAQLMRREGPAVFNGGWETHATRLLTAIGERIAGVPAEILIMDQNAMAPTKWIPDSMDSLFKPHDEQHSEASLKLQSDDRVTDDPIARWESRVNERGWEMDFGQTYLLHAFKSRGHDVPGFSGVSVPYVLAQKSNYALAAWPMVDHMLRHNIVTMEDVEP